VAQNNESKGVINMEKQSKYSLWAVILIMISILLVIFIIVVVTMDISAAYAWTNYIAWVIIALATIAGVIQDRYEKKHNIKSSFSIPFWK